MARTKSYEEAELKQQMKRKDQEEAEMKRVNSHAPPEADAISMEPIAIDERENEFFVSHCQVASLTASLRDKGHKVWRDIDADNLTARGMEEGVRQSKHLLLFLSKDYMSRPFCISELRWAKQYGCTFVGVIEKDSRRGAADFGQEAADAPDDLKHLFQDIEFVEFHWRQRFAATMFDVIVSDAEKATPFPEASIATSESAGHGMRAASGTSRTTELEPKIDNGKAEEEEDAEDVLPALQED